MRFVIAGLLLTSLTYGLQMQRQDSNGTACQLGCSACGFNWYYEHWNGGSPTVHYNQYCGCCGGSQAQQNVCKTACSEPGCYTYVGNGWCHVNGVDANEAQVETDITVDECKISCDNSASYCAGIEYENGACKHILSSGTWSASGGTASTQCYERCGPTPLPTPRPTSPPTAAPSYPTPVPPLHPGDVSETRTSFEEIKWSTCKQIEIKTIKDGIFRCAAGACIKSDAVCNWFDNCADGSDESPERCNRPCTVSGCMSMAFMKRYHPSQAKSLEKDVADGTSSGSCNTLDSTDIRDQVCYGQVVHGDEPSSAYYSTGYSCVLEASETAYCPSITNGLTDKSATGWNFWWVHAPVVRSCDFWSRSAYKATQTYCGI